MRNSDRSGRRRRGIAALALLLVSTALPVQAGFLSGAVPAAAPGDTLRFCERNGNTMATVQVDGSKRYRTFLPAGNYRVELVHGGAVTAAGSVSAEDRSIVGDISLGAVAPGSKPVCR